MSLTVTVQRICSLAFTSVLPDSTPTHTIVEAEVGSPYTFMLIGPSRAPPEVIATSMSSCTPVVAGAVRENVKNAPADTLVTDEIDRPLTLIGVLKSVTSPVVLPWLFLTVMVQVTRSLVVTAVLSAVTAPTQLSVDADVGKPTTVIDTAPCEKEAPLRILPVTVKVEPGVLGDVIVNESLLPALPPPTTDRG